MNFNAVTGHITTKTLKILPFFISFHLFSLSIYVVTVDLCSFSTFNIILITPCALHIFPASSLKRLNNLSVIHYTSILLSHFSRKQRFFFCGWEEQRLLRITLHTEKKKKKRCYRKLSDDTVFPTFQHCLHNFSDDCITCFIKVSER